MAPATSFRGTDCRRRRERAVTGLLQIPAPDPEWDTKMQARRAADARTFGAADERGQRPFVGTSLGAWLALAEAASVAVVPARRIITMPWDALMRFDEARTEDGAYWSAFAAALAALPDAHMVRWDPCSGLALKEAMAAGTTPGAAARELTPDDPRAYDILFEYPLDEVPVWSRPWVAARTYEGYPIEFRVFVRDSAIAGISSYYPQRSLPASPEILGYVEAARSATARVLGHLQAHATYPWMPSYARARFTPGAVHATLDFLVTPEGQVLFLEAGPPFGAGAHPCCFMSARNERIVIDGVALEGVAEPW